MLPGGSEDIRAWWPGLQATIASKTMPVKKYAERRPMVT